MAVPAGSGWAKFSSMLGWMPASDTLSFLVPKALTLPPLIVMAQSASMPPSGLVSLDVAQTVPPLMVR